MVSTASNFSQKNNEFNWMKRLARKGDLLLPVALNICMLTETNIKCRHPVTSNNNEHYHRKKKVILTARFNIVKQKKIIIKYLVQSSG